MITSKQCFDRFGQLRKKTWIAIYEFMHWELVIDLIKQVLQTYKQVMCYFTETFRISLALDIKTLRITINSFS